MWSSLPTDLIRIVLAFDGRFKYRNGVFMAQIDRRGFEILTRIPRFVYVDPSSSYAFVAKVQLNKVYELKVCVTLCPRTNHISSFSHNFSRTMETHLDLGPTGLYVWTVTTLFYSFRYTHFDHLVRNAVSYYTFIEPDIYDPPLQQISSANYVIPHTVSPTPHPDYLVQ